MLNIEYAPRS